MSLPQFNAMILFYCSAHSENADITRFENNGRAVTHVRHQDWQFTVKVDQSKPTAELSFINKREDTVDKHTVEAPSYHNLMPMILSFHWKRMSEVH